MKKLLIALALVFLLTSCEGKMYTGTVEKLVYSPSTLSTGVATTISASGKVGVGAVTTGKGERFILLVSVGNDIKSIEVSSKVFASIEEGNKVQFWSNGWIIDYKGVVE